MYLTQEQEDKINEFFKVMHDTVNHATYLHEINEAYEGIQSEIEDYLISIKDTLLYFNNIATFIMDIFELYTKNAVEAYRLNPHSYNSFISLDFNTIIQDNLSINNEVIYEEDQDNLQDTIKSVSGSIIKSGVNTCSNPSYINLTPYTEEDKPIQVYFANSIGKFETSVCITIDELTEYLKTDLSNDSQLKIPTNIMTIYKATKYDDIVGKDAYATGKLIIKLPPSNNYITFGSANRLFKERNKEWYALPLFDGKRRRIGNLDEFLGPSSDHGQIKGHMIYKLYTKKEIESEVVVKESDNDYPEFLYNNTRSLYEILGKRIDNKFISIFINTLISKKTKKTFIISDFLVYPQQNGIIQFRKNGIKVTLKLRSEPNYVDILLESQSKFKFEFDGEIVKANKTFNIKNANINNKIRFL